MKAQRLLLLFILAVTAAGFAASATAAMYKWTDKQGKVHYTQEPPPEGNAKEIAPPPRVATPATNTGASKSGADAADEGKSAAGEQPLTPEEKELNKRNCELAKGNRETYKTAHRIKQADGEIVYMDEERRQQKMQEADEQIKKFCN